MPSSLVSAQPAGGTDDTTPLSARQVDQWRTAGFVLVDDLLPSDLVEGVGRFGRTRFPAPGSPEAADFRQFGSAVVFPTLEPAFDQLTLTPRLLAAVGQLLDRPIVDIRLTQSDFWPKYGRDGPGSADGRYDNNDQRIHVDYPNHMLVHPAPWDRPEAVEIIVYHSDHRDSGGGTAVVPRQGPDDPLYPWPIVASPGIGDLPYLNDRATAEAYLADHRPELVSLRQGLYDREVETDFRPGTVLLYRHDVWHRGTPLAPGTRRLAQNLTFRRADCPWIDTLHKGWSWTMYRPEQYLERLVASASVEQRAVLGFPPPGSPYWCPETLEAVAARYGPFGFDPAPYSVGLGH